MGKGAIIRGGVMPIVLYNPGWASSNGVFGLAGIVGAMEA